MAILNGQLSDSLLSSIPWDRNERMIPAAVHDLTALNQAFRVRFGHDLIVNEAYRSLATQQAYYRNPPSGVGTAARPGTSNHGWGKAIDLHLTSTGYTWMRANASRFGFVNPAWAHDGKGIEEPWHWEHASASNVVPDIVVRETVDTKEDDEEMIILAKLKTSAEVYAGNGIIKSHVPNPRALTDLQFRINNGEIKGNSVVQEVDNIDWLGKTV